MSSKRHTISDSKTQSTQTRNSRPLLETPPSILSAEMMRRLGRVKRARDREKEKKDQEKRERQEERKRLRELRVEEMTAKVDKIRGAAGLRGKHVNIDEWRDVLEDDFDDSRWEEEMRNRFGESYYAEEEVDDFGEEDEEIEDKPGKKRKPKKPAWTDDIDIKDLVPEFDDATKPAFTLSSDDEANDDEDGGVLVDPDESDESDIPRNAAAELPTAKRRSKKDFAKEKADARRAARIERRKIEEIVDSNLPLEHPSLAASTTNQPVAGFRYRETSPTSFGLTARDILFADDSQLNQYAGLKKMAAFREAEKKRRDKKRYSKKGRLREWRKETFGSKDEPSGGFEKLLGRRPEHQREDMQTDMKVDGAGTKAKKRKRSKNKKKQETAA